MVEGNFVEMTLRLMGALVAGGLIGLERSYHGRPAGFRTHALVCLASSLLMLVTVYEGIWFAAHATRAVVDPTRMAQGIMTGIGFLGAGVIMKDGLTVRGLTTAASIWITAAIGVLVGIGFYFPALITTVIVMGTLSVFRWIESKMPSQSYAHFAVRFAREQAMPEDELRALVARHGFTVANLSHRLTHEGRHFEYRMVVRTLDPLNMRALSDTLRASVAVVEFRISPTGD